MADKKPQSKNVPALVMRGALQASTANAEARTVEVVWTTGARVLRSSFWDGPFYEELSLDPKHVRMGRLNNGAPFLADHNGSRVAQTLGVVVSAKLDGGSKQGTAVIRFDSAENDPEAEKVFRKIQNGIVQNVSVGYRVHTFEKVGETDGLPVMRATDWEPYEISAVAMGADDGAGFRSANEELNPCEFITRGLPQKESNTMTPEEIAAAEAKALEQRTAELKAAADKAANDELARVTEIRTIVRKVGLDETLADELIAGKRSIDQSRAAIFDKLAERSESIKTSNHVRATVTEDRADKRHAGMTAAILHRMGTAKLVEDAAKARGEKLVLDPGEFAPMSAMRMVEAFLEDKGVKTRGMSQERMIQEAFARSSGYATTGDLPVMMEEATNKSLLAGFSTMPDVWREFCAVKEVPDLRDHKMYRNGSFGTLDDVNENGEYKNKTIPDGEKFTISVGKKGNIIGLTEEMLINDDLGSLGDLAVRFGRSAALTIESGVFAKLAENSGAGPTQSDAQPFFHANRANLGSAAANTVASWDADRLLLGRQKDVSSNDYLGLRPEILLVADGKETEARQLNTSTVKVGGNNSEPNSAQGMFKKIIASPRVAGTKRYAFANPNIAPVIFAVFLSGKGQGPTLESKEGWRNDGIEWKIKLYFKVNFGDSRGAVYNPGA